MKLSANAKLMLERLEQHAYVVCNGSRTQVMAIQELLDVGMVEKVTAFKLARPQHFPTLPQESDRGTPGPER